MKRNNFINDESYNIYHSYIQNVKKAASVLSNNDVNDILNEIDSHIYESFIDNNDIQSEKDRIEIVLRKLGTPESYLKPIIAERKLKKAVNKYNIWGILKGIWSVVLAGSKYALLSIMYFFILTGGIIIIAKILYPNKTGLFVSDGDFVALGFTSDINSEAVELLGYWLIPIMILAILFFYFAMTFILKKLLHLNNNSKKDAYYE